MGPIDAVWHLLNLLLPAAALGGLAAAITKAVWRQETRGLSWWGLAWPAAMAAAAMTLGGLLLFGQDGRMATYGAMVVATAITLWWRAFLRRG